MIEVKGNLWDFQDKGDLVITTNGDVNSQGKAVMGRGVALQASIRFPMLSRELARSLRVQGNVVTYFSDYRLFTFPVKHHWFELADKELIKQSVHELEMLWMLHGGKVYMPRPGCGNGKLTWDEIRPLVTKLNDNFIVVQL